MTNNLLHELGKAIVEKGTISEVHAKKILSLLGKNDLKKLMDYIRTEELKKTAFVTIADETNKKTLFALQEVFPKTKLVVAEDKKIGAGVKVQIYDMIYDLTVKSKMKRIVDELEEEL